MHEKFKLAQSRRQFARLWDLAEEQQRALAEDPKPFLDRAYKEVSRHRRLLDDLRAILSGMDEIRQPPSGRMETIESILDRRQRKALKLLREFSNQPSGES